MTTLVFKTPYSKSSQKKTTRGDELLYLLFDRKIPGSARRTAVKFLSTHIGNIIPIRDPDLAIRIVSNYAESVARSGDRSVPSAIQQYGSVGAVGYTIAIRSLKLLYEIEKDNRDVPRSKMIEHLASVCSNYDFETVEILRKYLQLLTTYTLETIEEPLLSSRGV